jgi:cell division protein FtsA
MPGRQNRKNSKDSRIVAALDIGGAKAACVIAAISDYLDPSNEPDVIGVGQYGIAVGAEPTDPETALRGAIDNAERMAGVRVESAFVTVGGKSIGCRRVGVDLDISGNQITRDDLRDCVREGERATRSDGSSPLHTFPIRFLVDGEAVTSPEGMMADVLTAEILGLSVRDSLAANIEALCSRVGVELDALIAAPVAAGEAVVIPDEKELGVLMIDLGARTTNFALYEGGALAVCGGINIGADHITKDIAQVFGAPISSAERIKTLYGSALVSVGDEQRLVDFKQLGDPSEIARHSRAELAEVISSRVEEILELTMSALSSRGVGRRTIRRAVLTGGGSLLTGIRESAERVLSVKTRLGRPSALAGAPDAATAPQFAASIGAIRYATLNPVRTNNHGIVLPDWLLRRSTFSGAPRLIGNVGSWLRANF